MCADPCWLPAWKRLSTKGIMRKMQRDYKHSRPTSTPEAQDMNVHETYNKVNEGASPLLVSSVVTINERFSLRERKFP